VVHITGTIKQHQSTKNG